MADEKDFYIYTRNNKFFNYSKLNDIGKYIYAFLKFLSDNRNDYFHRVNSIKVTSQDRAGDSKTSPHYKGKAFDIVINPPELMPYFAGVMHACLVFNIYLGTYTKINNELIKNLHIHLDQDYSRRKNFKGFEDSAGNLSVINTGNIEPLLKLYNFGLLTSIQDFGKFEKSTIEYLLTNYNIGNKLAFNEVVNPLLKEKVKDITKNYSWILYVAAGLLALNLAAKILPKKEETKNGIIL